MAKALVPQPRMMSIWRAVLACATFVPAFLCSLFLRPGSLPWALVTAGWALGFLLCYLWYLPRRMAALSLRVEEDRFILTTGVLRRLTRIMPFDTVQFVALRSSPLHRHCGLASVVIVAAGGRMLMPGLDEKQARLLAGTFFYGEEKGGDAP